MMFEEDNLNLNANLNVDDVSNLNLLNLFFTSKNRTKNLYS